MAQRTVTIAVNGVTGRMGYRQHLVRSLLAIRQEGGVLCPDGSRIWPELVLVGRNASRVSEIAKRHDLPDWSTDLGEVLARDDVHIYFDAQVTAARAMRSAVSVDSASGFSV